jgi:hypothetical protein
LKLLHGALKFFSFKSNIFLEYIKANEAIFFKIYPLAVLLFR